MAADVDYFPVISSGLTPTQEAAVDTVENDARLTALSRARELLGTTINTVVGTHWDNIPYVVATSGTGTVATSATAKSGVLVLSSGATNSGLGQVRMAASTGTTSLIDNPRTALWYIVSRMKVSTAIDAAALCSLRIYTAAGSNPQVTWGVTGSVSTTHFVLAVIDGAGSVAASDTSTVAIDTSYHTFEMWNDGTNVHGAIDGVDVADTPSAGVATNASTGAILTFNGATNAARTIESDTLYICTVGN